MVSNSESRSREKNVITNLSLRGFLVNWVGNLERGFLWVEPMCWNGPHTPGVVPRTAPGAHRHRHCHRHRHPVPPAATPAAPPPTPKSSSNSPRPPRLLQRRWPSSPRLRPRPRLPPRRARPPRPRSPPSAKKPTLLAEAHTCSADLREKDLQLHKSSEFGRQDNLCCHWCSDWPE